MVLTCPLWIAALTILLNGFGRWGIKNVIFFDCAGRLDGGRKALFRMRYRGGDLLGYCFFCSLPRIFVLSAATVFIYSSSEQFGAPFGPSAFRSCRRSCASIGGKKACKVALIFKQLQNRTSIFAIRDGGNRYSSQRIMALVG